MATESIPDMHTPFAVGEGLEGRLADLGPRTRTSARGFSGSSSCRFRNSRGPGAILEVALTHVLGGDPAILAETLNSDLESSL
jgi:hypothetical protein